MFIVAVYWGENCIIDKVFAAEEALNKETKTKIPKSVKKAPKKGIHININIFEAKFIFLYASYNIKDELEFCEFITNGYMRFFKEIVLTVSTIAVINPTKPIAKANTKTLVNLASNRELELYDIESSVTNEYLSLLLKLLIYSFTTGNESVTNKTLTIIDKSHKIQINLIVFLSALAFKKISDWKFIIFILYINCKIFSTFVQKVHFVLKSSLIITIFIKS